MRHEHEEMQNYVKEPDKQALVLLRGSRRTRQTRGCPLPPGAETNAILQLHYGTFKNRDEILVMDKQGKRDMKLAFIRFYPSDPKKPTTQKILSTACLDANVGSFLRLFPLRQIGLSSSVVTRRNILP